MGVVYRLVLQFTKLIRWVRFPSPTPTEELINLLTTRFDSLISFRYTPNGKVPQHLIRLQGVLIYENIGSKIMTAGISGDTLNSLSWRNTQEDEESGLENR